MTTVLCTDSQILTGKTLPKGVTLATLRGWHETSRGLTILSLGPHRQVAIGQILDSQRNHVATLAVINERAGAAALSSFVRWGVIFGALLAIVLAFAVGVFVAGMVFRPLEIFAAETKRIAEGDFSARLPAGRGGDAFADTALSFNAMAESLENAFESIEEHNAELEAERDTVQVLNEQLADKNAKEGEIYEQLQWQYSQLEVASRRLQELAHTDGLTGLFNHRTFYERLASAHAEATRHHSTLSVMMLDLDHFKAYNDALGHPAGDEALRGVARVIQETIRESDFAARYGGEEFAVGLPQTSLEGALALAERIRVGIEGLDFGGPTVTISVGVASLSQPGLSAGDLVVKADAALYKAKRAGRNQVCFMSGGESRAA